MFQNLHKVRLQITSLGHSWQKLEHSLAKCTKFFIFRDKRNTNNAFLHQYTKPFHFTVCHYATSTDLLIKPGLQNNNWKDTNSCCLCHYCCLHFQSNKKHDAPGGVILGHRVKDKWSWPLMSFKGAWPQKLSTQNTAVCTMYRLKNMCTDLAHYTQTHEIELTTN